MLAKIDYESPALPRLDPQDDPAWNEDQEQQKAERDRENEAYEMNSD